MVILLWAQPLCLRPGSNWVTISEQGRGVWIAVTYSLKTPESSLKTQLCNSWLNGPKRTIWGHFCFSIWNSMARSRRAFPFLKLITLRRKVDNFPRDPKLLAQIRNNLKIKWVSGMSMVLLVSSKCLLVSELLLLPVIPDYPIMAFLTGGKKADDFCSSSCFTTFCIL